jgi:hypothetical protein
MLGDGFDHRNDVHLLNAALPDASTIQGVNALHLTGYHQHRQRLYPCARNWCDHVGGTRAGSDNGNTKATGVGSAIGLSRNAAGLLMMARNSQQAWLAGDRIV